MCIVFGLQLCMYMICVSGACRGQMGALAPLEPSLQTVVSHHGLLVINSRFSVRTAFLKFFKIIYLLNHLCSPCFGILKAAVDILQATQLCPA